MNEEKYMNPLPAVDAIIDYEASGKYIYVVRGGKPYGKALPGGFAKFRKSYEKSIEEEVFEETNLEFKILGLLGVYSDPARDPRDHITTTVYYGIGYGKPKSGDDAAGIGFFTMDHVPEMVFDHNRIIGDYKRIILSGGRRKPTQ